VKAAPDRVIRVRQFEFGHEWAAAVAELRRSVADEDGARHFSAFAILFISTVINFPSSLSKVMSIVFGINANSMPMPFAWAATGRAAIAKAKCAVLVNPSLELVQWPEIAAVILVHVATETAPRAMMSLVLHARRGVCLLNALIEARQVQIFVARDQVGGRFFVADLRRFFVRQ